MADNTTNQQTMQAAAGSAPPPIGNTQATSWMTVPAENMPVRTVTGQTAQQLLPTEATSPTSQQNKVVIKTRSNPKGKEISIEDLNKMTDKRTQQQIAAGAPQMGYTVNQLLGNLVSVQTRTQQIIDAKGNLRNQYSTNDAVQELLKLDVKKRISLLNDLYSRGMFPGKQGPSPTGLDDSSVNAMQQFLLTVNQTGYTWDVAKPIVMNLYPNVLGMPKTGAAAQTYTVSNPADIERVANQVSEQIIGRRISQADMQKIIQTVQGRERAAGLQQGGEIVSAPSAQTIAQQQIEQRYAQDAQLMRAGNAMQFTEQLLRSI